MRTGAIRPCGRTAGANLKALAGEKDRHIEDYKELVQERNVYSSVCTIEMLAYRKVYCCSAAGVPRVALCVPGG